MDRDRALCAREAKLSTPAPVPALPEYWLRGPLPDVPALLQPVAHALLQARDELHEAVADLTPEQLWARPADVAAVGFHLQHIAGVIDRLCTYARGEALSDAQRAALAAEGTAGAGVDARTLLRAVDDAVQHALAQLRATDERALTEAREVGRARLPSTVQGLLFHAAEHTQRHTGQLLVTARVVRSLIS